jgi:hypothetical protein
MTLSDFLTCAVEALRLLALYPFQWLLLVFIFLVVVEGIMFIPVVGFTLKLWVASIAAAQTLVLFASAAHGQPPDVTRLIEAFYLPATAQLVLFATSLLAFMAGLLYLYLAGGAEATSFFFGNILKTKPPERALFFRFKVVMQVCALPFTFLAGAVVLKGLTGWAALGAALSVAAANWPVLLLILAITLAFEWFMAKVPELFSKALAATITLLLLGFYVAWSLSLGYTVSAKALAAVQAQPMAQPQ